MRIIFKSVTIQNFLSFGNIPVTFDYTNGINIVTGTNLDTGTRNGVGKSSLLVDSISFALYGKTLRGAHVNKDELINKINKKGAVVTADFEIGKNIYKVTRTIKPNGLTVFENDIEIKFDTMKNTQEWLDDKLSLSHTCFSNIVVLNINNSQPFLAMDAAQKREVLEDVLSMKIYGKMSEVAKDRNLNAKSDIKSFENEYKNNLAALNTAISNRDNILKEHEKFELNKQNKIIELQDNIKKLTEKLQKTESLLKNEDYANMLLDLRDKEKKAYELNAKFKTEVSLLNKSIKEANDVIKQLEHAPFCPTCHVPSDNPIIIKYIDETKSLKDKSVSEIETYNGKIQKVTSTIDLITKKIKEIDNEKECQEDLKKEIPVIKNSITLHSQQLETEKLREFTVKNVITESDIETYRNKYQISENNFNKSNKTFMYSSLLRKILGEDGIRKFVLSKILPFLNNKVNHYMKIMGSDMAIKFDSNLNETIITRNREERFYTSFSGGEKKRIDISVLLALMDLSKLQNSVDTNILVLDEVLDTAMDGEGVENFLIYLKEGFKTMYPDKSVYIITHRNSIAEDFYDSMIILEKKNGFTKIKELVTMK